MMHITVALPDEVAQEYYTASEKLADVLKDVSPAPNAQTLMRLMLASFTSHDIAAPQAKEWLDQQSPEVKQRVAERLDKISPFYREKAAVRVISQEKAKLDFTPRVGQSMAA